VLGRSISDAEEGLLLKYLKLLEKWSSVFRLTGSARRDWIVENLLLDSLLFLRVLPAGVESLLDLGAGAGVPGIPIKIVKPALALTLLEARRRRASFLSTAVRELGLSRTRVIHARADQTLDELRGSFDAVVMRCAGSLDTMLPLATKFTAAGGIVVASGPPQARHPTGWNWVTVPALKPGTTRRFAVVRVT
jgi:16S rRNA (guanine527-N7)-methyltransferase